VAAPRSRSLHPERHRSHRAGWLRAAVLGANDGLLSTAGLLVGVVAAGAGRSVVGATGVAALVAGAASMAVGELSSVASQRDAEEADLAVEAWELEATPRAELGELTQIYVRRGLTPDLAAEVAEQLTAHDALEAHARDELGLDPDGLARPVQAAVSSAASFSLGALVPLLVALLAPRSGRTAAIVVVTLVGMAVLGALGARLGGAAPLRPAARVVLGGATAMAVTAAVGTLFDVTVT
jgi:VIT1/CCC1 family predicted Fe2+/Mn2+ transporter